MPEAETARQPYVILVTGSRTWKDEDAVWAAIAETIDAGTELGYTTFEVRHGTAEGADRHAHNFCEDQAGWYDNAGFALWESPQPADWSTCKGPRCKPSHRRTRRDGSTYCPTAGLIRDDEMVAMGAHACLAFIDPCSKPYCRKPQPHGSHGATHTADQAEKAGILTRRFPEVADA